MNLFDKNFDFNRDGKLDWLEKAARAHFLAEELERLDKIGNKKPDMEDDEYIDDLLDE